LIPSNAINYAWQYFSKYQKKEQAVASQIPALATVKIIKNSERRLLKGLPCRRKPLNHEQIGRNRAKDINDQWEKVTEISVYMIEIIAIKNSPYYLRLHWTTFQSIYKQYNYEEKEY
jgi:hypothetical protein